MSMIKPELSKIVVERAIEGKSTIVGHPDLVSSIPSIYADRQMEPHGTALLLEAGKVWSLEKQLVELQNENKLFRDAVSHLLLKLRVALDLTESLSSFLREDLSGVENVRDAYVFRSGEVTNVWLQLLRRDVDSEMAIAETQRKIFRLFPNQKLRFLVVPRDIGDIRKDVPRHARRLVINR
jgi:hypothetical protein